MSCPSTSTVPVVGVTMPQMMLMRVVLPAPFGPSRAKISPRRISRLMFFRASKPEPNFFDRFWTEMTGDMASMAGRALAFRLGWREIGRLGRRGNLGRELVAGRATAKTCIRESARCVFAALLLLAAPGRASAAEGFQGLVETVNVIDGADGRDSLLAIGPALGLSSDEIARIRKVSGYV